MAPTAKTASATCLGVAAVAALMLLSACDEAKPRRPSPYQPGPLPQGGGAPAGPAAAGQSPVGPASKTTAGPLPAYPLWAEGLIGKALKDVLPNVEAKCIGNTDVVDMRYTGDKPGVKVEGWGWDPAAKKPVQRVLLVDNDGKVAGAGETGLPRPDVVAARREITSPTTGWQGVAGVSQGGLSAYGVLTAGKTGCRLGHIDL